jgi:enediyne biosynthesis protein E4
VTTGAIRQRMDVFSGGSYGSSSDQRPHFGLGTATKIDKLEIIWPDGEKEEIPPPAVDQILTIALGEDVKRK